MMSLKPTVRGGRIARGDTPFGAYRVEWDMFGHLISEHLEMKTPEIPDNYDPRREGKSGCCDPPDPSMKR